MADADCYKPVLQLRDRTPSERIRSLLKIGK